MVKQKPTGQYQNSLATSVCLILTFFNQQGGLSNRNAPFFLLFRNNMNYTATNIPFMYSFLGIARPQSKSPHSCVCERFIYSQDRSTYFPAEEWADQSWEYINHSQTHKCGDWDYGHAIPFLGIFVSNFRPWFFAVYSVPSDDIFTRLIIYSLTGL